MNSENISFRSRNKEIEDDGRNVSDQGSHIVYLSHPTYDLLLDIMFTDALGDVNIL